MSSAKWRPVCVGLNEKVISAHKAEWDKCMFHTHLNWRSEACISQTTLWILAAIYDPQTFSPSGFILGIVPGWKEDLPVCSDYSRKISKDATNGRRITKFIFLLVFINKKKKTCFNKGLNPTPVKQTVNCGNIYVFPCASTYLPPKMYYIFDWTHNRYKCRQYSFIGIQLNKMSYQIISCTVKSFDIRCTKTET